MKKRKGMRVQNSKSGSAVGSNFHEVKMTPRGLKGPKSKKKLLPPWREVRDEVK